MRVVAGIYRSRQLKSCPGNQTRPTLAKVKEAVFSSIGPYFEGGSVLDLFAGSGAMGIECLSRGMEECIFVDKDRDAILTIQENLKNLKIEHAHVWKMDYKRALQQCAQEKKKLNLIYLDPPYHEGLIPQILDTISQLDLLSKDGLVICEGLKEDHYKEEVGILIKKKEAIYGITKIAQYRRKGE